MPGETIIQSQTAYLNGEFMPLQRAKISPMDRGFLFGDGIYEVIPCIRNRPVGLKLHLQRMQNGLDELNINYRVDIEQWKKIIHQLVIAQNEDNQAVYIHISRGADSRRFHAYPKSISPTVFAYGFAIPSEQPLDCDKAKTFRVKTEHDLRWHRCHIKSTSLLGNVMHFQQGQEAGLDEVILYNDRDEVTEAAACNVFVVQNNEIATPPLDNQLLPGITRKILIDALQQEVDIKVNERIIHKSELYQADEIWITSSTKEVGAVSEVDGKIIGNGKAGKTWLLAQRAFNAIKFDA